MTRGEKSVISSALLAMTFRHQTIPNKGFSLMGFLSSPFKHLHFRAVIIF